MTKASITIKIHVSWWVRWYLASIAVFAKLFGVEPDLKKIGDFIRQHGIRTEVQGMTKGTP